MDIDLARSFLEIVRSGSFVAAAARLHVTQTTVTARIHNLEAALNTRLFVRNRAGARLTADGERFVAYAARLVETWEAARRDLPLAKGYADRLVLGGEPSLCNPALFNGVRALRAALPQHALRVEVGDGATLQRRIELGTLDVALVHRPDYRPGLQIEQVLEEKLIQICVAGRPEPYVYVDWGDDFRRLHDAALPAQARAGLHFDLGPLALQYLLQCGGSGYFRTRVVQPYLDAGVLHRVAQAPEFAYPVYLVHARERASPALREALQTLRETTRADADWSQRWEF